MIKGLLLITGVLATILTIAAIDVLNGSNLEVSNIIGCADTASATSQTTVSFQPVSFLPATSTTSELLYEIKGRYERPISSSHLENANSLKELILHYPENWIEKYISTEVSITTGSEKQTAKAKDATLSTEQKNILRNAKPASKVTISVNYFTKNAVRTELDESRMEVELTVIPDKEANYPNGKKQLIDDLKSSNNKKFSDESLIDLNITSILFTIDKNGGVEDVKLAQSSGNKKVDNVLLESIWNMSRWIPAENKNGEKVKQQFEFTFGPPGC